MSRSFGDGDRPTPLWVFLGLLLVLLVAIWPRAANLDGQILWIDEDLTYLAVDGILKHGVPELPSGMVYSRGFLYSYVLAGFSALGGLDAVMMRLPSILFSLALIYAVFYLGREVRGPAVGLAAAAMLAVSPWDIHYARMARMYELLALFVVVAVYLGVRYQVRDIGRAGWSLAVLLALSIFVHRQAALLAPLFFVPLVLRQPELRWSKLVIPVSAIGAGVLAITAIERWTVVRGPRPVDDGGAEGALTLPIVGAIDFNETRLWLGEAFASSPIVASIAIAVGVAIVAAGATAIARHGSRLGALAFVAMGLATMSNQIQLTAFAGALALKLSANDIGPTRRTLVTVAGSAAALVGVVAAGLFLSMGMDATADRQLMRSWFSYPVPWPRLLLLQHPGVMLGVVAGSVWFFLRSLRPGSDQAPFYLVCSVWLPLLVMGIMPVHYFAHRYTFYLNPLLVTLFVATAVEAVRWAARSVESSPVRVAAIGGIVVAAFGLGSTQFHPLQAYAMPERTFGYNFDISRDRDVTASFHYDFTGPAAFIAKHGSSNDVVIARDPTNLYPYLRDLDYGFSGRYDGHALSLKNEPVDWYLGIPYLADVEALDDVLRRTQDRRRWIIYTRHSDDGPNTFLTDEQLSYLDALDHRRVYTGRDGLTVVIELPPATRSTMRDEPRRAG